MFAKENKPQVEVPEEVLTDQYVGEDAQDEEPVFTQPRPGTAREVDWADQQTDGTVDGDGEYSWPSRQIIQRRGRRGSRRRGPGGVRRCAGQKKPGGCSE